MMGLQQGGQPHDEADLHHHQQQSLLLGGKGSGTGGKFKAGDIPGLEGDLGPEEKVNKWYGHTRAASIDIL